MLDLQGEEGGQDARGGGVEPRGVDFGHSGGDGVATVRLNWEGQRRRADGGLRAVGVWEFG